MEVMVAVRSDTLLRALRVFLSFYIKVGLKMEGGDHAVDGYLQWAQSRSNGHATGFSGSAELQNTAVLWCQRLNVSPFSHSPFMYLAV